MQAVQWMPVEAPRRTTVHLVVVLSLCLLVCGMKSLKICGMKSPKSQKKN